MKNVKFWGILISFLSLMILSPIQASFWYEENNLLIQTELPGQQWKVIEPESLSAVSGYADDCIDYSNYQTRISDCSGNLNDDRWKSQDTWNVTEAAVGDLNRDGMNELILVVWRPFKPWPIDSFLPSGGRISTFHNNNMLSCHLILIGWDGEKYREFWAGSALADPIFDINIADLNGDGNQELITLEHSYDSHESGKISMWEWNGFGFRLVNKSSGQYSDIVPIQVGNRTWILTY